jgi:hypothetical protein
LNNDPGYSPFDFYKTYRKKILKIQFSN